MVKWKSYPEEKDWTEEPAEHMLEAKESLWNFQGRYPRKPQDPRVPTR
jgi:hypothetical protein